MVIDKHLVEKYAMLAEKISQENGGIGASVHIPTISKAMSLSDGDAQSIALFMRDMGWIAMKYETQNSFVITLKGWDEIAKLKRPTWQRWLDAHWPILAFLFGSVGTVVASLIIEFLKHYFWSAP